MAAFRSLSSNHLSQMLRGHPQALHVHHMSTMKAPIARVLLSTNPSRQVDISHENEISRGVKTSGEKQDPDNPSLTEKLKEEAQRGKEKIKGILNHMGEKANKTALQGAEHVQHASESASGKLQESKEQVNDNINRMGDQINDAADSAKQKMVDAKDQSKQSIQQTKDTMKKASESGKKMVENTRQRMGEAVNLAADQDDGMSDRTKESMRKVGNSPEHAPEAAAKRMQGMSYNSKNTVDHTEQSAKDSYDIPAKVAQENKMKSPQDEDVEKQHIQPGTRNLSGTRDNFDNDPGLSIDMMQDKIRETKDKIKGGKDHVVDNVKQSLKQTSGGIMDSVKGLKDVAKETVHGTATKTKEFLTGERNDEKPEENKSQVHTEEGVFPPGTKVDKEGKPKNKQGQSWQ